MKSLCISEAGSGKVAGILGAIGVALVGAASGYFAYQKKKLCFKPQGLLTLYLSFDYMFLMDMLEHEH